MEKTLAVCIREVQKSLKQSVKRLVEDKIQKLGVGSYFEVQDAMIKTPHGGQIIFQGMQDHTAESIKSLEGFRIAWVEEAQSLSLRSLELLRPTIREAGSELWFSWNPTLATDPVDTLLRGSNKIRSEGGVVVVEANWQDNPWFPRELRDEMASDLDRSPEIYDHVWNGAYETITDAMIFRNRVSVETFDTPSYVDRFYYGADWGFANDPTVLVRCFIANDCLYVDYEAFGYHTELDDVGNEVFDQIPGSKRWPITADCAQPAQISYMKRQGYNITGADKWPGSVEDGVKMLKAFRRIIVHSRCVKTAQEFRLYSYKVDTHKIDPDTNKPMVLPVIVDKHNHAIDSLRYALGHFIQGRKPIVFSQRDLAWATKSRVAPGFR